MKPILAYVKQFIQWIPSELTGWFSHFFFGVSIAMWWPNWWMFSISQVCFLTKEFYIDKHFETTPQTFKMNLIDWATYTAGVVVGLITAHLKYGVL